MGGDSAIVFPHLLHVLPQYLTLARRALELKEEVKKEAQRNL